MSFSATGAALNIDTTSLPGGTVGVAYSQGISASGGTPPYGWSVTAGSLPPGLSINAGTGAITGTPTTAGTYAFTVGATDAASGSDTQPLSIVVASGGGGGGALGLGPRGATPRGVIIR